MNDGPNLEDIVSQVTDVILSRIGELMLAVAETRSLEGRSADAAAIERAVNLFAEGAAAIPRPVR